LPVVPGPRPARLRLLNAYVAQVQAAGAQDPRIAREFLRVANLVQRPETLLYPATVSRVIGARIKATTSARRSARAPAIVGPARADGDPAVIPAPRTRREAGAPTKESR
jgi:hypothetical protein